jgi:hypothetical protein
MSFLLRGALFFLLLGAGIAAVVYGARFHAATVSQQQEVERDILIPLAGFAPDAGFGMPGGPAVGLPDEPGLPGGGDGQLPGEPQGFMKKKIKQQVLTDKMVSEPSLNREVSVAGVALAADGTLLQTYSGRPPSLCPT